MTITDRLFNNLPLKLASLFIALMIWAVVHNQADPLVTRRVPMRVEVVDVPATLAVADLDPEQINVTVYGRTSALSELEYSNFRVTASVAKGQIGTQKVPLTYDGLPAGLRIKLSRALATVDLDAVVSARRPVFVEVRGDPAPGFAAGKTEVDHDSITISGPSSQIQKVARVVAEVDVSGRNATVPASVTLVPRDASSLIVSNVQVDPAAATVTVQIKQINSKTVPVVPIINNLPSGDEIGSVSVKPVTVTLTGDSRLLADVSAVQTAPVNLSGGNDRANYTVTLRVPPGLTTVEAATVQVRVDLRAAKAGDSTQPETQPQATPASPAPPASPAQEQPAAGSGGATGKNSATQPEGQPQPSAPATPARPASRREQP